ncbi:MAG: DUF4177 domain-containing protein [Dinoroseobacter sp.]|nr:DUF4177 domain-containing protein [Dinoroseobacter sp.]
MKYEYRVIPSPVKGMKAKGVKTPEERFAHSIEHTINELAQDNWEYVRAETLPAEERVGLTSKVTKFHNMLVFRRALEPADDISRAPLPEAEPKDTGVEKDLAAAPASDTVSSDFPPSGVPPKDTQKLAASTQVATPANKPFEAPQNRQMMGILRTIKGDRSLSDTTALQDPALRASTP